MAQKRVTQNPLPEVEPCPCGKGCAMRLWRDNFDELVVTGECGWEGPPARTERAAILAWNRRAPDGGRREPWIVSKPGVMGGKPCVRGTRITVETLQAVAHDWTVPQILEQYPGLTCEGLAAALAYEIPEKTKARKR